jgi:hypothetical protein
LRRNRRHRVLTHLALMLQDRTAKVAGQWRAQLGNARRHLTVAFRQVADRFRRVLAVAGIELLRVRGEAEACRLKRDPGDGGDADE